ncbi:hypothetical protein JW905_06945 [bacterium]|nr:hypothetical protein [candidate division CSSED10-310 bacterium]
MQSGVARERLIILGVIFLAVVGFMLYLRQSAGPPSDQSAKMNEIRVAVEPGLHYAKDRLVSHDLAEFEYIWRVDARFKTPDRRYKIKVHFTDEHGQILFQDDHYPPDSIQDWVPGTEVRYKRVIYVPPINRKCPVTVMMGLYDQYKPEKTVLLLGDMAQLNRYQVGVIPLEPPVDLRERLAEQARIEFKQGWYPVERDPVTERTWRWMERDGTIDVPFLGGDALLFLNCWIPRHPFERPSTVTLYFNNRVLCEQQALYEEVTIKHLMLADSFEGKPFGRLRIEVDQTYIPRKLGLSDDHRELGLMLNTLYYRLHSYSQKKIVKEIANG